MKRIITIVIVLGLILGGIVAYKKGVFENSVEYVSETKTVQVEKKVEVDALEKAIHDAQEAHRDEIEQKAREAYDAELKQGMTLIELQVVKEWNARNLERQKELEKDVTAY